MHGLAMRHTFKLDMIGPMTARSDRHRFAKGCCVERAGLEKLDALLAVKSHDHFGAGAINLIKALRDIARSHFWRGPRLPVLDQQLASTALIRIDRVDAQIWLDLLYTESKVRVPDALRETSSP